MEISTTPLAGLLIIQPKKLQDQRGYFYQSFQQKSYEQAGIPHFVQDNFSLSKKNVLRGLHYQLPYAQGKLVYVTQGYVWDVAVDIRKHSPTFGNWFGILLNEENNTQLYIPPGFAHGFCVLSDQAHFHYKCTEYYSPENEHGLAWNDPGLNISWPIQQPLLSTKDQAYPNLSDIKHEKLFT